VLMKNSVVQTMVDVCAGGVHTIATLHEREATLLAGGGDGTLSVLCAHDGRTFQIMQQVKLDGHITSLSPSMDGVEALCATATGSLFRARLSDLSFTVNSQLPTRPIHGLCFSHNVSDQFLSASGDGVVTVWDSNDYSARLRCWQRGCAPALCVAGTPDILVAGYQDGKVRSFDMFQGALLWDIENAHRGGTNCIQIAQNARFILTGGKEGDLRVWELRTREMVSHLKEHSAIINDLHLFDNDRYGISVSRDHQLFTWDLQAEKRLTTHREKHGGLNACCLLNDQTTVITAGQERKLTMWDLRTQDPVYHVQTEAEVMSLAFDPNSNIIASGGTDKKVKLWDPRTLQCLQSEQGHSQAVDAVAFSPDGKQVVSGGYDHCVYIWNAFPL